MQGVLSKRQVFILSAPSGAGKTSLAKALVDALPNTVMSISHTTRDRRPGEVHGGDYYFVGREEFENLISEGSFLEYAEVFDNFYGTLRSTVDELLEAGNNVILDIDWQGAREVRRQLPGVVSIFVVPPSLVELERRLRDRGQDSDRVIARRMRQAVDELRHHDEYDYLIRNDHFQAAFEDLVHIVSDRPEHIRPTGPDMELLLGDTNSG